MAEAAAAQPDDAAAIAAAVQSYFAERAARITIHGAGYQLSATLSGSSVTRARYLADVDRLAGARSVIERLHPGYAAATVSTSLAALSLTAGTATAEVIEETVLPFVNPVPGSPFSAYVARHSVQLAKLGSWTVVDSKFRPTSPVALPPNQFEDEHAGEISALIREATSGNTPSGEPALLARPGAGPDGPPAPKGTSQPGVMTAMTASYNYSAMVSYASSWYYRYNGGYPQYGEDCTNFVSQCLHAGGWAYAGSYPLYDRTSNSNWYAGGYTYDTSYTWSGANNFKNFAAGSGRTSYLSYISYMSTADLLGYDYNHDQSIDHWQIVTGFNNAYSPYTQLMTQHTPGYWNKPLSEILVSGSSAANAWHSALRT